MIYHLLIYLFSGGGQRHYAYESSLFRGMAACLLAFGIVWQFGPVMIRWLVRKRIGDVPDFDRLDYNELTKHKANVPTMGGLLLLIAVIGSVLLLADLRNFYIHLALLCAVWLGALGMTDDWLKLTSAARGEGRDGLKPYQKLLFQIGLGVLLATFIFRHGLAERSLEHPSYFNAFCFPFLKFPAHYVELSPVAFMLIAVLVITGTSNAVNLTDGMDGLASGCLVVSAVVFMVLAEIAGNQHDEWASYLLLPSVPGADELAVLCGAIAGACLGFLWYNCHPAQVFMGDTGSLALGGLIGYVAIVIRQELMLFIVGGIFVIEAASVIIQVRYYKWTGKRVFRMAPLHHHFHLAGWRESQVVVRFWLMSVLFAILALVTIKLR